jgi:di/tricarboxylate transporter
VTIAISLTVAIISSFMQNIGAAALFLPAIQRISKMQRIPLSRLLMPIGFSAILGGTVTLVGSSPLILLNDLLVPFNLKPFGLFDVTPIGLALVLSGIVCFVLFGRFILPKGEAEAGKTRQEGAEDGHGEDNWDWGEMHELTTPDDFTLYRDPVTVRDMTVRYLCNVVAMTEPPDYKSISPSLDMPLHSGIEIVVYGRREDVERLASQEGLTLKDHLDTYKYDLDASQSGIVEAVVSPRSNLVGKTLHDVNLRDRFRISPLCIYRQEELYRAQMKDIPLQVGDVIRLFGTWKRLKALQQEGGLLFSIPTEMEYMRPEKAIWAGLWLTVALVMIMGFKVQLSVSLMTGALGMVLTRVLSIDEAYNSVDWRTIFLLAGLIPLGIATEKTGTAAWIAHAVLSLIGTVSPLVLLGVIGLLSTLFTLVISNVGATVLLVPLVVNMAVAAHTDPRMAALVVGLATSNSFMLPTHQVNALYMGPGRYRTVDYMKSGLLVSIVFLIVMIAMIALIYGV